MQDRYTKLRERLEQGNRTHVPIVVEVMGERHHALFRREMTIKQVREEIVTRLLRDSGGKSGDVLLLNGVRPPLTQTLERVAPNTVISIQRGDHQIKATDVVYLVLPDGSRQTIDKLPCVIGRSRQAESVDINLIDQPEGLTVSRRHAELSQRDDDNYYIRNITENPADRPIYLNEDQDDNFTLDSAILKPLSDGNTIRLGKVSLVFHIEPAEHSPE